MGTKYSNQTVSGYNTSPPSDDGSQVASNQVKWSSVKTKLSDPLNTFASNINSTLLTALDSSVTTTAVNYTTQASDHIKPIQVTAAATISLGDASTMGAGYVAKVVNLYSAAITVNLATAGNTLNTVSAGSISLQPGWGMAFAVNQAANGYNIVDSSFIDQTKLVPILPQANIPAASGTKKNLVLTTTGVDSTVTITADELVLESTNNIYAVARSVNITINAAAAAGNLSIDTGSIANNTWYAVWILMKTDGTIGGVVSLHTSIGTITLPSGYVYGARVGYILIDNTVNKYALPIEQRGRSATWEVVQTVINGSMTTSAWTAQSMTAFAPPTASRIRVALFSNSNGHIGLSPYSTGHGGAYFMGFTTGGVSFGGVFASSQSGGGTGELLYKSTMYYWTDVASSLISAIGWEDNL